jgi:hypothetical protein
VKSVFKTAGFNHSPIPPIPILPDFTRLALRDWACNCRPSVSIGGALSTRILVEALIYERTAFGGLHALSHVIEKRKSKNGAMHE